ncbi:MULTISPECIES: hypothetical protein [unclassified Streptomyces]
MGSPASRTVLRIFMIGDLGGVSRLDGNGYYAKTLRSAKRL